MNKKEKQEKIIHFLRNCEFDSFWKFIEQWIDQEILLEQAEDLVINADKEKLEEMWEYSKAIDREGIIKNKPLTNS